MKPRAVDVRISRMRFAHWLKRRDKHDVMWATNSFAYKAPSSNQQTFIHERELRSFERVTGKFFP